MNIKQRGLTILFSLLLTGVSLPARLLAAETPESSPRIMWYQQPAKIWNEALPVGNGRLGAMVFGGVNSERLQLNEDSLWSGAPQDSDNPEALTALPEIRRFLFAGKYTDAQALANKTLICRGPGSNGGRGNRAAYGSYQTLGDLTLDFVDTNAVTGYRRELDLETGIARVSYERAGVCYEREVFSSYPDQTLVMRLTASKRGALNFLVALNRADRPEVVAVNSDGLLMRGQLGTGNSRDGMKYAARLQVLHSGGKVVAQGGGLKVTGAQTVTLLLTAATDYRMQLPDWRGENPEGKTATTLKAAAARSYQKLRAAHVSDFTALTRRVVLNLGLGAAANLPTDQRLSVVTNGGSDVALEALYFQFGRYLLISSSRPGGLPANLQGLWADGLQPPWGSDYHANINLEMNYWPVEAANLAECFEPLERYVNFLTGPGARTAKIHYNARGWTTHTLGNVWGFTSPGESPSWGLTPSAGAWLAQSLWDHFAFTHDTNYLQQVLPVLRGSAEFSLDWLVEDPKTHQLVAGPATSPENKFITADGQEASLCMGPMMEQEIIGDAFANYQAASTVLGWSNSLNAEISQAQVRLARPKIAADGRLMEWSEEFKESEPGHRHLSHLFAVHPGHEITLTGTPELAAAARKSLEYRLAHGSGQRGWSRAWIVNFWARLGDGNAALENLEILLAKSTLPNLFDNYPPFQIDANFGATAGICEMLLQSQAGEIQVLPALPHAWRTGSVKGLCARGGYEVDIAWQDGQLVQVSLHNVNGEDRCTLQYQGKVAVLKVARGKSKILDGKLQPQ